MGSFTERLFSPLDYVMVVTVLASSSLIGVYFAWTDRKNMSNGQFLMAGRKLGAFPVAMSLMASFQSATTYLGYPSEMFYRGTQYWVAIFGLAISNVIAAELYLPVLYELRLSSVNEYLERRFNRSVRMLAAVSFTINNLLYMGVVLYGPSLALEPVIGVPVWVSIVGLGLLCTFYTTLGGVKAVVWTDVMQMSVAIVGMIALCVTGIVEAGGLTEVFARADQGGRIQLFNSGWDPSSGTVIWNVLLGTSMVWLGSYGTSQTEVQRLCSVSSLREAKIALYCNIPGVMLNISLGCLAGLVIYAKYYDCDPLKAGYIHRTDQLMPFFVMDVLGSTPGLPGLFVAVIFSAALSTMSSGFNSLAAVAYEDFLQFTIFGAFPRLDQRRASVEPAATYGFLSIGLAFLAGSVESLIKAAFAMSGALSGPLLGVFTLGMLAPRINGKSALLGLIVGQTLCIAIVATSLTSDSRTLATSIGGCIDAPAGGLVNNSTSIHALEDPAKATAARISYLLVPISGFCSTVLVAFMSVIFFGLNAATAVDQELLAKFLRRHPDRAVDMTYVDEEVYKKAKLKPRKDGLGSGAVSELHLEPDGASIPVIIIERHIGYQVPGPTTAQELGIAEAGRSELNVKAHRLKSSNADGELDPIHRREADNSVLEKKQYHGEVREDDPGAQAPYHGQGEYRRSPENRTDSPKPGYPTFNKLERIPPVEKPEARPMKNTGIFVKAGRVLSDQEGSGKFSNAPADLQTKFVAEPAVRTEGSYRDDERSHILPVIILQKTPESFLSNPGFQNFPQHRDDSSEEKPVIGDPGSINDGRRYQLGISKQFTAADFGDAPLRFSEDPETFRAPSLKPVLNPLTGWVQTPAVRPHQGGWPPAYGHHKDITPDLEEARRLVTPHKKSLKKPPQKRTYSTQIDSPSQIVG
ncbi:sodium-coupled monocarboxylate transporter 1 [Galendromus occidentalis]|uniref:Sodium-coupled monocarboxylate transporter 1 n=1 Tax=Galendromus occidentalis TaxID=34638 RepID=A0AAJ7SH20_9ACAR|nr:sodium-coupled monocarboxylate transporter 1 [Galendromus occidentalis]